METTSEEPDNDPFEFEALDLSIRYKEWIISKFRSVLEGSASIAEVGAGVGHITTHLFDFTPKIFAVEPEEAYQRSLGSKLRDSDTLIAGTSGLLEDNSIGSIISVNVLEHIEHDVDELKTWHQKLVSGGKVCLLVPARQEIYAPIDSQMGHYRRYSTREVKEKFEEAGFHISSIRYFNFLGYFLWLLKFRILKATNFESGQIKFYESCILPLALFLDQLRLNSITGQSVVCVAEKSE